MPSVRLLHFYLGVFFAPLIVFYAFTGTLQVFKLHESYRQVAGSQGNWVAWFGQFHKEQAWLAPRVAPARPAAQGASPPPAEKDAAAGKPMKWLVAAMGVALMLTTLLGLWIASTFRKRRRGFWIALGGGIVVPLALMAF
jgi:uncharacterized iron-regulated membrane protein